ncbi:DUF2256 domain-containing protein [Halothiobacillus sp. DCM-1]|uniref:DUF2256 domain-containing protein n=1 Tax=Halothiobacillus sp. DCM-1 TaxID=3112558 RepID=UPI00324ECBEC
MTALDPRRRRAHDKADLPTKCCPVCQRPFVWRKKWARDWDQVRYCSEACRRKKSTATPQVFHE